VDFLARSWIRRSSLRDDPAQTGWHDRRITRRLDEGEVFCVTTVITRQAYRADVDVFFDARRALDHYLSVPTTVQVQVLAGVASLTGRVRWRGERAEAEAAVRQVPGVLRVTNHIAIETATPTASAS
jgi:hypothetical protein